MDLTNSPFRVAIPISFPGIVTLGLLLWRFPILGWIVLAGGLLDGLSTFFFLSRAMASKYRESATGLRFLGFNLGRGLIVNLTNLCTWAVGAWYVSTGVCSLGLFLASLSWSSHLTSMLSSALDIQKQWLETMLAIRPYFTEIDSLRRTAEEQPEEDEAAVLAGVVVLASEPRVLVLERLAPWLNGATPLVLRAWVRRTGNDIRRTRPQL